MVRRNLVVENNPAMADVRFLKDRLYDYNTLQKRGTTVSGWRSCCHDGPTVSGPNCSNTFVHVLADAVLA
jgi:hypothetical protein